MYCTDYECISLIGNEVSLWTLVSVLYESIFDIIEKIMKEQTNCQMINADIYFDYSSLAIAIMHWQLLSLK